MSARIRFVTLGLLILLGSNKLSSAAEPAQNLYSQWKNGPPHDENFFPIAVWLQDPRNAERFKAAGINTYVGLWRGPTTNQLDALSKAGMRVICSQNKAGLQNKDNPVIVGWMHGDEPDNAQSLGKDKGYGPPILPEKIVGDYERISGADPTRPVLLNLGQGVAWDNYIGRGVRRRHPEDYPEYIKGCDIASFDIYPVVHDDPEVVGKLEFVPQGVERLRKWSNGQKIIWNCIECTHIGGKGSRKATPDQVRSEVWMSLIHGSQGIIYFVHQFEPNFREAALLDDSQMLEAVTALNKQIHELAPTLNSPSITNRVEISSSADAPIASMVKMWNEDLYIFTSEMRSVSATAKFRISSLSGKASAEVLGENRTIPISDGEFKDQFTPYAVHLYRILKQR
jgi:hypothetical protein